MIALSGERGTGEHGRMSRWCGDVLRMKPCLLLVLIPHLVFPNPARAEEETRTETFDRDPGWHGNNNRSARELPPIEIRQDFGYSDSSRAGGKRGEIGGFITPAGEAAYYAKAIAPVTLNDPLTASGAFSAPDGAFNLLLGFFNAGSVNEWRTPNSLAIRLNGRGDRIFAYVEYCTSRWRAGGDTTPFPSITDPQTGRWNLLGYPCQKVLNWTIVYDPQANDGQGTITATIGDRKSVV